MRPPTRFGLWIAAAIPLGMAAEARGAPERAFSVEAIDESTLVLHRVREGRPGTEGVVVDSARLLQALEARVLQARGLGDVAKLEVGNTGRASSYPFQPDAYVFPHQFSAPFSTLQANLRLQPLAEPDAGTLIYPLLGLLAGAIVVGLYALYRMTAAQVAFAERRNNFVSAVSHELKTPLTAIRMYSEMLEEDLVEDDAKRHEYYRTISGESERLTRLINNVLELSNLERRRSLELRVGDPGPVVQRALKVLEVHVAREGFSLDFDCPGTLPAVSFDPDALNQVVFNLVDNALKYGREAKDKRVVVRCEAHDGGVRLLVRDTGPGVQREHLQAIFEPFFRGERELTRKNKGAGLGLSIVKGLVDRMGGRVYGQNTHPGFEVCVELSAAGVVAQT